MLIPRVARLQQDHRALKERYTLELENARDTIDLLEFQLAELTSVNVGQKNMSYLQK